MVCFGRNKVTRSVDSLVLGVPYIVALVLVVPGVIALVVAAPAVLAGISRQLEVARRRLARLDACRFELTLAQGADGQQNTQGQQSER